MRERTKMKKFSVDHSAELRHGRTCRTCIERNCEFAGQRESSSKLAEPACVDGHQFSSEGFISTAELVFYAQIVLTMLVHAQNW